MKVPRVVLLYSEPDCEGTKTFLPHFEKNAEQHKERKDVIFLKGDRDDLKEHSHLLVVGQSPTVIFFKDGHEYTQISSSTSINEKYFKYWLNMLLLPSLTILKNEKEKIAFLKKVKHQAVIGYFPNENKLFKELKTFKDAHVHFEDFGFAAILDKEIVEKKGKNVIEVYKNENEILQYKEKDLSKFFQWIALNVYPKITSYSNEIYFRALQSNLSISIVYINETTPDENQKHMELLEKISKTPEFESKFLFSHSDEMSSQEHLDEMTKKNNTKLPLFGIILPSDQYKLYLFDKEFSTENEKNIHDWMQEVLDGKINPSVIHDVIEGNEEKEYSELTGDANIPLYGMDPKDLEKPVFEDKEIEFPSIHPPLMEESEKKDEL